MGEGGGSLPRVGRRDEMYRCEATSVEGFVQQFAVAYVTHGYYHYVVGRVPDPKDPRAVDEKIIEKYDLGISSRERSRRKKAGWASVQYLRYERFFIITATEGRHRFKEEEGPALRDIRRRPLQFFGYSIGYCGGHVSVRIARDEYKRRKAYFLELATRRRAEVLGEALNALPYERYARVQRQLLQILRAVNRKRALAGFEPIPQSALRLRRRIYRPFEVQQQARRAA